MGAESSRINELNRQMQITKVCRMNASHRLDTNGNFLIFINVYYSILIATISILALFFNGSNLGQHLSILGTVLSIALTISITYANSIKYKERAHRFKDSYVAIQNLQYKLSNVVSGDIEQFECIQNEYIKELNDAEEHIPYDYHKYEVNKEDTSYRNNRYFKQINKKYIWHNFWTYLVRILLIGIPFIIVVVELYNFLPYRMF